MRTQPVDQGGGRLGEIVLLEFVAVFGVHGAILRCGG